MQRSDEQLLQAVAAGDADAFAAFFRRHEGVVTAYAVRRCPDPDAVADVVAEAFLGALRGAGRYRADHDDAVPWLLGIAVRVLLRHDRTARRWLRLGARVAAATPRYAGAEADAIIAAIDAAGRRAELESALASLPRREREVLELIAHADLTPAQAATALGISPNAARLRLSRARARMRGMLGDADLADLDPEAVRAR